jgi:hypothetical protein
MHAAQMQFAQFNGLSTHKMVAQPAVQQPIAFARASKHNLSMMIAMLLEFGVLDGSLVWCPQMSFSRLPTL